ncbi:hypothetical protein WHR41_03692 [Cladosporium halotolerans]|uniref:Pentatricopeptide repeat protein n=1 Tax=Cladosporium halotolerans TaxID=1052096 RepID=A0AB34KX40_9PEZI
MSAPYVCKGCRLRLAIRPRQLIAPDRRLPRRSFSRTSREDQDTELLEESIPRRSFSAAGTPWKDSPEQAEHVPIGRYSRQPLRPQHLLKEFDQVEPYEDVSSQTRSGGRKSTATGKQPGHQMTPQRLRQYNERRKPSEKSSTPVGEGDSEYIPRGRYSGQPLRPHQLLQEFDRGEPSVIRKHVSAPSGDPQNDHEGINPRRQTRETSQRHQLREKQHRNARTFMRQVNTVEFDNAWNTIIEMRKIPVQYLRDFPRYRDLTQKLYRFMCGTVVYFVNNPARAPETFTPLSFIQVVNKLDLLSPTMLSGLLWRLSNGIAERAHAGGYESAGEELAALHQLVAAWYEAMVIHLQRTEVPSSSESSDRDLIEWSLFPSPETITLDNNKNLSQTPLNEVLGLILPTDVVTRGSGSDGSYQSALFVSVDLMSNSVCAQEDDICNAFLTYFSTVLKRIAKPAIPQQIRSRLELSPDPSLAYYEQLVRRLEFADIPAVRENRGKPEPVARESAKPTDIPKSVSQGDRSINSQDDSQAASFMEPAPASENTKPVNVLDKAALINAGFSVSEVGDMDADVHREVSGWIKRLGRCIESSNLHLAEKCWAEASSFIAGQESGPSSLPLFLYEHFMLAFVTLRQPRQAVHVWNVTIEAGLNPTVKTWTVMMRGCSRADDADTMERFWTRMRSEGVQPDQHAWSVRVFCLFNAKRISDAFSALHEMGQEWIAKVQAKQKTLLNKLTAKQRAVVKMQEIDLKQWDSDVDGVPRPSLVVVNSAVSSLANKSDEHIPKVLSWARDFAIEFDLTTYNTLLNVAMRHGRFEEASVILQHMRDKSIEPNSTTTTVLLTALFQSDYFSELSMAEQTTKLLNIMAMTEASTSSAGLDAKGYALIIDRMLKKYANHEAARAVLEHMSKTGLEPTSHIYTILMTSYFDADPPDLAAVDALWSRIESGHNGFRVPLDTIFYERMVEGYARHHSQVGLGPVFRFLEVMSRQGKRPSWQMLETVARAFAECGEWARLRGLVDDVRESKGLLRVGVRGLSGQNEFWRYIIGTGVLDDEHILHEQQLYKGSGGSSFQGLLE